jgi:hypothetical protein
VSVFVFAFARLLALFTATALALGQILEIEGYKSSLARIQDSTEANLTARDGQSYIEQDNVIGFPQESIDAVVNRRSNWRSRASTHSS